MLCVFVKFAICIVHRIRVHLMLMYVYWFTVGDQVLVDTLLQDGSEVFRAGGGSSILVGGNNHNDTNSLLLVPRNNEGKQSAIIQLYNHIRYTQ